MTLVSTHAGLAAMGIEPKASDSAPTGADEPPNADAANDTWAGGDLASKARTARAGTKQAMLIEMLRTEKGATTDGIVAATRWLPHMVGEAIAGALKKKLGPDVTSE